MRLTVALFLFALVGFAATDTTTHYRGCIYRLGKCVRECEVGTRAYATGCSHLKPEPTCDEPQPVEESGIICDFSACYCEHPTVRDKSTDTCVPLDECPKK